MMSGVGIRNAEELIDFRLRRQPILYFVATRKTTRFRHEIGFLGDYLISELRIDL